MPNPGERTADCPPRQFPLATRLSAAYDDFVTGRPPTADEDVHMLPGIVEHVIDRCSRPGDLVVDPFAGFGTTIERAVALGREAIGVELLPERVRSTRRAAPGARVHEGDARELLRVLQRSGEPFAGAADLVLTSPPYMTHHDHDADPLTAYELDGGDYERYLSELGLVAAQCAHLLVPGGWMVWNVADICHRGQTTHLIADCARVLDEHLVRVGITEIGWDRYPHDLVADALLVYRRP
ncbi:MAG: DNA methyltransferase [Gordonia sp. (in: high G+C Gram-positive bacteria)]|uniref:DNA methyltransferase n=1 Tax=Gordonia TaxID=2053 RepID=UPI003263A165